MTRPADVGATPGSVVADLGTLCPIDPESPAKAALREIVLRRLSPRSGRIEKEPMFTPTGGRPIEALPPAWRDAASPETARRHAIFRPSAVEALLGSVRPDRPYLPRALVVVATTHRWLELEAIK